MKGEIHYKKNCGGIFLLQALRLMQTAAQIKRKNFGMMGMDGQATFLSRKDFLYDAVKDMPNSEKELICRKIQTLPEIIEPAFVFYRLQYGEFCFQRELSYQINRRRTVIVGDPSFLYGVIKSRNPYMYAFIGKEAESEVVDLYEKSIHTFLVGDVM